LNANELCANAVLASAGKIHCKTAVFLTILREYLPTRLRVENALRLLLTPAHRRTAMVPALALPALARPSLPLRAWRTLWP
jgi:hypothetical protein